MKKIICLFSLALAICTTSCSEDSNEESVAPVQPSTKILEVKSTTGVNYYYNIEIYVNGELGNSMDKTELTPFAKVKSGDVVKFKTRLAPGILIENTVGAKLTIVFRLDQNSWSEPLTIKEYTNQNMSTWYFKDANDNDKIIIP